MRPMAASAGQWMTGSASAGRLPFYAKADMTFDTSAQPLEQAFQSLRTQLRRAAAAAVSPTARDAAPARTLRAKRAMPDLYASRNMHHDACNGRLSARLCIIVQLKPITSNSVPRSITAPTHRRIATGSSASTVQWSLAMDVAEDGASTPATSSNSTATTRRRHRATRRVATHSLRASRGAPAIVTSLKDACSAQAPTSSCSLSATHGR